MAANIFGKCVYSFEKPMWHNITEPSDVPMGAEEILDNRFGGGFSVETRPITVHLNGENVETGDFAVVRTASPYEQKEVVFGYCTDRYQPLQPREVCRSFDTSVLEPAETMGFLGKGEQMFVSWKMPSFDIGKGDTVDLFGILKGGFDTLHGYSLFTSTVRVVCQNTLNFAEQWAKQNTDGNGQGQIWKGRGVNKNLLRDVGYWMSHVQENAIRESNLIRSFFGQLAKTPITSDAEAKDILLEAFPAREDTSKYYPRQLKDEKAETIKAHNEKQEEIRGSIFELFSGAGTAITPDYWGMLNSTTEYFCHYQPSKKPIAESVMFGARQKNSMNMVKVLAERVK
jgi:hypothetical protein